MHYISEFLRSKPLAVCTALKLPKSELPLAADSRQGFKTSKNRWRNWHTQTKNALQTIMVERKNSHQTHYRGLLEELARDLIDIQDKLDQFARSEPLLDDRLALVQDLRNVGRYDDACRYLDLIRDEQALMHGDDSLALAGSHLLTADMLLALGRYPEARRHAAQAQDIYISNSGVNNLHVLESELVLTEAALQEDRLDAGQEIVTGILHRAEMASPPSRLVEIQALLLLAQAEGLQRRFPAALEMVQNASTLIQEDSVEDPTLLPKCIAFEGILYRKMAKWEEAEKCFAEALAQLQGLLPAQHIDMGRLHMETGRFYMLQEEFDQAGRLLAEAQEIFVRLAPAQLERLIVVTFTARLSRMRGEFKLTKRMVRRGLKAKDKLKTPNSEWEFRLQLEHVHLMLLDGRNEEAEALIETLLAWRERPAALSQRGELHLLLGQAQWQQQKRQAAIASLQRAQGFLPDPILVAEDLHVRTKILLDLAALWIEEQEPACALQALHDVKGNLALHTFEQDLLAGRHAFLQGRISVMIQDYSLAQTHFNQALAHLERRAQPRDPLSAACRLWQGKALLESGNSAEAADVLQSMVDSPDQEYKHLPEADRVQTFYDLALALSAEGQKEAAFKYNQRAYKRLDKLEAGDLPPAKRFDIGLLMGNLHADKRQYQAARDVWLALLADMSPQNKARAGVHEQLAEAQWQLGALAEAETHWRDCLVILAQFHTPTSPHVFQIRAKLAQVLEQQEKWKSALDENKLLYQASLAHKNGQEQRHRQFIMAQLHQRLGHPDQSQRLVDELLQEPEQLPDAGLNPLAVYLLRSQIAAVRQRLQEAQSTLQQALSRFGSQGDELVLAETHAFLASLLAKAGKQTKAIEHWQQALAKFEEHDQTDRIWECLRQLVKLLWQIHKREESIAFNDKALKLAEAHPKRFKKPLVIRLLLEQGEKYALNDKIKKALDCYKQGIKLAEVKKNGKHVSLAAQCLLATADLLAHKKPKEAKQSYQKVRRLYGRKEIAPDVTLALSCMQYGRMLWDCNEMEAALEQMTDAHAVYQQLGQRPGGAAVSQNQIMSLQYRILLHADLGHWHQAMQLLEEQLRPTLEALPRKSWPKQLTMETINEQSRLMQLCR